MSVAGCASIGWIGCSSVSRNVASPSLPDVSAAVATAPRSPASISARRTSIGRDVGRLRDRVGHQRLQRSLPELAGQEPCEELLLRLRRAGREDRPALRAAPPASPRPVVAPIFRSDASTSSTREHGRRSLLRRTIAKRGPADADRRVRQLAREVRNGDRHLFGSAGRPSTPASASIFFRRARVDATSAETSTSSFSSTFWIVAARSRLLLFSCMCVLPIGRRR